MNQEQFGHGGLIWEAARQMGLDAARVLDYSANMNPYGPPEKAINAIVSSLRDISHYPDPQGLPLRARLAEYHSVGEDCIVLSNGAAEAISLLPPALGWDRGVCCSPTFSEYGEALLRWGGSVEYVPLMFDPSRSFSQALMEAAARVEPGAALFVCNPNNPTGEMCSQSLLRQVHEQVLKRNASLVVDESFFEFTGEPESNSMASLSSSADRLIVIRSMTKFYSIPGLRLGYIVARASTCRALRRFLPPWNVNHLAQVSGLACLEDSEYRNTAVKLSQNREELRGLINNTGVLRALPSCTNFILVQLLKPGITSTMLASAMKRDAILVRDCSTFPGMGPQYIRLCVKLPEQNRYFVTRLHQTLGEL